ncbi:MAG: hypothetical protein PHP74_01890 [Candidatus Gracilibacteria bacterium]|nr:hypothetical protein [Candidatus Gracilibacteria bacterium]
MGKDKPNFNDAGSKGVDDMTPEERAQVKEVLADPKLTRELLTPQQEAVLRMRLGKGLEGSDKLASQAEGASEEVQAKIALITRSVMDYINKGEAALKPKFDPTDTSIN